MNTKTLRSPTSQEHPSYGREEGHIPKAGFSIAPLLYPHDNCLSYLDCMGMGIFKGYRVPAGEDENVLNR